MTNNKQIINLISFVAILFLLSCISACGGSSEELNQDGSDGDTSLPSIEMSKVIYTKSSDKFPNPERGFYKHEEGSNPLSLTTLKGYRNDNISLILRMFYLSDFKDKKISDEYLQFINTDLSTIRKARLKAVLRFAYSHSIDETDAPLNIILDHLDQLKPYLEENKDVIAVLQAGFIGSWGEWYYTTNNLNNVASRKAVLDKLLEVLPEGRCVQVRTPNYKIEYVGSNVALTTTEAFSDRTKARIGFHNDAFLASVDDYGTYDDIDKEKAYLNEEGLYVPIGGETCPPDGVEAADCSKAQSEMRYLRWSYLNQDYYKPVLDNWVNQGGMEDIIKNLGYRFYIQQAEYSSNNAPGSELLLNLNIQNEGYAAPFNPRGCELILVSSDGNNKYVAKLENDPRTWLPYKLTKLQLKVSLPANITDGNYKLYLNLPDAEVTLHDMPEYSIRMANNNCWNSTNGYNDLNITIKINSSLNLPKSNSEIVFKLK